MADWGTGQSFLVTGASGFIGKAVCTRLIQQGAIVHGVSRTRVDLAGSGWQHWQVDLTDAGETDKVFDSVRPDYVLHLAGCVTGRRELDWVRETLAGNLLGTVNLLVAAQTTGVSKVVLAGSLEEPADDECQPVPASPYAASKWAASGYARMFHALYGIRISVARIFMVYGPGQADLGKLVPYVCLAAASGQAPKLMSGGRRVDWIYIDDLVDGLLRMLQGGPEDGSHVDLGTGTFTTTGEVARQLCELAGTKVQPELGAVKDRSMEQVRLADLAATEARLTWVPSVALREGLRRTLKWYREGLESGRLDAPEP